MCKTHPVMLRLTPLSRGDLLNPSLPTVAMSVGGRQASKEGGSRSETEGVNE